MELLRTEGVILSTLDFKDFDLILTVFSCDLGLVKLFFKGGKRGKKSGGNATDPLTQAEFIYSKGRGDLLTCREISIINTHINMRKDLPTLEAGCDLIQTIQKSQIDDKPSPPLYQLLTTYMANLPKATSPEALATSFRLKILRHDGLFGLLPLCSTCQKELKEMYTRGTESYCAQHAPQGAFRYTEMESNQLLLLAFSRKLQEIEGLCLEPAFVERIKQLFNQKYLD